MAKPEIDTEHPFYGHEIIRANEQEYIKHLLKKYKGHPVDDLLKQKIWDELQMEKYHGKVTIPFKVVLCKDPSGLFPEYVDVILDTKV